MTNDPFERAVRRDEERYRAAAMTGFRHHLFWYVAVNVLLVGIWFFSSDPWGSDSPWFIWSILGWGVGVASHWWAVRVHRTT